jgi:hypothetical protein
MTQQPLATNTALSAHTDWREDFAYLLGMQAYIYGYPAIHFAKVRYATLHGPRDGGVTPVNQLFHKPRLSNHNDKYGGSPMRDAIYSSGWLDLSREPIVAGSPDGGGRYVGMQFAEFYSDLFGYIGSGPDGHKAEICLLVGPAWQGDKPAGIDRVLRSPTPCVMAVARVSTPGGDDIAAAREIQQRFFVKPLSVWRDGAVLPIPPDVFKPFDAADPLADFRTMNVAMRENPPPPSDEVMIRQFGQIGLGPFAKLELDALDAATRRGLARALVDGHRLLGKLAKSGGNTKVVNNWAYGDRNWGRMAAAGDFLGRASPQAFAGTLEHWIEQSTKLRTFVDADGQDLTGENRYVLHFTKEELPKAKAFWSITLYDELFNLAANDIKRYSIGDMSQGLVYGSDGSLTIHLQFDPPPADNLANWLPTPRGSFNLFLRTYLPEQLVLQQMYEPPAVCRI